MTSAYETRGISYSEMLSTATDLGGRGGVSEAAALGISSVWCGVRVISETIGSLPLCLFAEEGYKRQPAKQHPLRKLFRYPNPEMTQPVFFECVQAHALLWGTAFAEIERDGSGRPVALWPVHPRNVTVVRDALTGRIAYRVTAGPVGPDQPGTQAVIPSEDMIVVPGLSPDGTVGYRLLTIARGTIGFALSAQRYGESFFNNAARPGGALEHPGQLSDVAREKPSPVMASHAQRRQRRHDGHPRRGHEIHPLHWQQQ